MKPIQAVVVVFAALVAYIVFFFGVRQTKLNRTNRRNLFLSTFFLFLVFLSFGRLSYAQEDKPTVSEQPRDTQRLSLAQRVAALNNTAEWKNFKVFWKKLDQTEPKKTGPDKNGVYHIMYHNEVSPDEWGKMQKESEEVFSGLNKIAGDKITAAEINFLRKICVARVGYIFQGSIMTMTRMMIPADSVNWAKPDFLADLELKIDRLLVLKKAKVINASEYHQALSNIQQDIKAFCVLDLFSRQPGSFRMPFTRPSTAQKTDEIVSVFEKDFTDYQTYQTRKKEDELTKSGKVYPELSETEYLATKKALADFKESFSGMKELIADLEND